MERLTESRKYYDCEFMEDGIAPYMNKLATYEDAEEQGRLVILQEPTPDIDFMRIFNLIMADADGRVIVLPCKVGDTVYIPVEKCRADFHYCPFCGGYGTARCDGDKNCKAYVKERGFSIRDYPDIGKTVFLTREEAEKALEGMR